MPGRIVRRGRRYLKTTGILAVMATLVGGVLLALNPNGGAEAAQPNSQLVSAAIAPQPVGQQGEVFFDRTFPLILNNGGTVRIGANPDGSGAIAVDDRIIVTVTRQNGSQDSLSHTFADGTCQTITPAGPLNITPLLLPGNNVVRVQYADVCGTGVSAGGAWIAVNNQPTTMRANPSVAEVAADDPLAEVFLTLSAKLTETNTSYPLAGRLVSMRSGDASGDVLCTDLTDADGEASCGFLLPEGLGAIPAYTAVFAGDAHYGSSQDTAPLIDLAGNDILPVGSGSGSGA